MAAENASAEFHAKAVSPRDKFLFRGIKIMATLLLIIIYISFIGLGIPDSLLGTAWPAIYADFRLPISFAGFISIIISSGTIISSLISAKVINLFGTNKVSSFSTAMTAFALLGFSVSANFISLCLFAIPLGLGAGAIDTALNNYVSLHYSATHMNFLHCFYGIGVTISPYILSLVINNSTGWKGGYRIAFGIQFGIASLLFLTLSIWKKAHHQDSSGTEQASKTLPFREIVRVPGVRLMWCLFITSCAIEYTCGGWGSTYLVEYKHMDAVIAARMVMLYYMGMALGRFLSGILAARLRSWQIIRIGQWLLGISLIILLLPVSSFISAAALFMVGLGNGPLFPNFNYLTPQNFGADISQSVMGTQMAMSYIGIMLAPAICGVLGQFINMGVFPVYLFALYAVMITATKRVKIVLDISPAAHV